MPEGARDLPPTHHRKEHDDLVALQARMKRGVAKWGKMPNKVPDGDSVCHLIESVGGL
ncbi:MAG TPA: hypothetical protein VFG95_10555 [Nitrospiria bacterium]|nr:hypothetical protein [Nitrospiria bacterium]